MLNLTVPKYLTPAEEMAASIVEVHQALGCCTDEDLGRKGFTRAEIAAHADEARRIARQALGSRP